MVSVKPYYFSTSKAQFASETLSQTRQLENAPRLVDGVVNKTHRRYRVCWLCLRRSARSGSTVDFIGLHSPYIVYNMSVDGNALTQLGLLRLIMDLLYNYIQLCVSPSAIAKFLVVTEMGPNQTKPT